MNGCHQNVKIVFVLGTIHNNFLSRKSRKKNDAETQRKTTSKEDASGEEDVNLTTQSQKGCRLK